MGGSTSLRALAIKWSGVFHKIKMPSSPASHCILPLALRRNAVADAADAQGAQARLRSKQLLLDVLCERIRQAWPAAGGGTCRAASVLPAAM